MTWPKCNTTLEDMKIDETPIWHEITFHKLGLYLSAIFGLIAVAVSFFLIYMHATHYSRPYEQRHIVRILFMVPVYATVSFLSYLYYQHSIYYEVLRDCYEAFAISAFFSLMCSYLAKDLHEQKEYFRTITPKKWLWPIPWFQKCCGGSNGFLRTPRSGLTWFNVVFVCVFQYCMIRVLMTIVAVITQAFDRYCLESLNPAFAHVWVMVIEAISVTVAMFCLIQFYVQIRGDIQQHRPLQKIIAIKLVIFLSFWQTILISFFTSTGVIKSNDQFQPPDIKVGIPAMLLCIEMAFFAVFHLFAFSWKPYVIGSAAFATSTQADNKPTPADYQGGFLGYRAYLDAWNPIDLLKASGRSMRWLFIRRKHRHQDISYDATRMNSNLKLSESRRDEDVLKGSTSYKPNHSNSWPDDDRQTLLSAQQSLPVYPPASNIRPSPYSERTEYIDAGDIGVAHSTEDNNQYFATSTQESYGRQTTGVTSSSNQRYPNVV